MSPEAIDCIKGLLTRDVTRRLGATDKGYRRFLGHAWFKDIQWDLLETKAADPPFTPDVSLSRQFLLIDLDPCHVNVPPFPSSSPFLLIIFFFFPWTRILNRANVPTLTRPTNWRRSYSKTIHSPSGNETRSGAPPTPTRLYPASLSTMYLRRHQSGK